MSESEEAIKHEATVPDSVWTRLDRAEKVVRFLYFAGALIFAIGLWAGALQFTISRAVADIADIKADRIKEANERKVELKDARDWQDKVNTRLATLEADGKNIAKDVSWIREQMEKEKK